MPHSAVKVNALWDDEAKVYVATSDDVPGLVTEAPDLETLMRKLRVMVPELLEANNLLPKRNHHSRQITIKLNIVALDNVSFPRAWLPRARNPGFFALSNNA